MFLNGIRIGVLATFFVAARCLATDVSGDQVGAWSLAGSPYHLVGDVTVPPGESLTIEPGVEVIADGHYRITVDQSLLTAVGNSDAPILMTAADTSEGWRGLRLESADSRTTLSYCVIEYAKGTGDYPEVRGGAMLVKNCSPLISHNTFQFNLSQNGNLNGCGGAICTETSSASILYNLIIDNVADSGGGIATTEYGTPVVRGNVIRNNTAYNGGGGMYLGARSSPLIEATSSPAIIHLAGAAGASIRGRRSFSTTLSRRFVTISSSATRRRPPAVGCTVVTIAPSLPTTLSRTTALFRAAAYMD